MGLEITKTITNKQLVWLAGSKRYWLLQVAGWTIYFFVNLAFLVGFSSINSQFILGLINVSVMGFIISHAIRLWIDYYGWVENSFNKITIGLFSTTAVGALIWEIISVPINVYLYKDLPSYNPAFFSTTSWFLFSICYGFICLARYLFGYQINATQSRSRD